MSESKNSIELYDFQVAMLVDMISKEQKRLVDRDYRLCENELQDNFNKGINKAFEENMKCHKELEDIGKAIQNSKKIVIDPTTVKPLTIYTHEFTIDERSPFTDVYNRWRLYMLEKYPKFNITCLGENKYEDMYKYRYLVYYTID